MALVISVTTIIIVAASVGGALILGAIIATSLLIRRRIRKKQLQDAPQRVCIGNRWDIRNAPAVDDTAHLQASPERVYRKPSKAPTAYPRYSWSRQGLLPSRQNSIRPADLASGYGNHLPRPHRLKKLKSITHRESALVGIEIGPQPSTSHQELFDTEEEPKPGRSYAIRARKAKVSTPSSESQVISIILTPENSSLRSSDSSWREEIPMRKTGVSRLCRSLIAPNTARDRNKSPMKGQSIATPATGSSKGKKNRRSLSVPFISSSNPPSSAMPPIPTPSNLPRLLNTRKTRQIENSPSKESFISRTTIGSSIFDSLSPTLRNQLREMSAGLKRPALKQPLKRRSSAPSLPTKPLPWLKEKIEDDLERRPSGASSQLLPSPAKPIIKRHKKNITLKIISKPNREETAVQEFTEPVEGPSIRVRDVPIGLSGLNPDWNVFGYDRPMNPSATKLALSGKDAVSVDNAQDSPLAKRSKSTTRPKVLQRKWTQQENHAPLSFAAVAYSSTLSLDTPLQFPILDQDPSSAYSVQSIQPQGSTSGLRAVISPCPTSHWSSSSLLREWRAADNYEKTSPFPCQGLFGPRRMPSIASRVSVSSPTLPLGFPIERSQSRLSHRSQIAQQCNVFPANENQQAALRYQFEELSADEEEPTLPPYKIRQEHAPAQRSHIDPPPVRLDPTPLRQSFYGYEAVPSFVSGGINKSYVLNKMNGNENNDIMVVPPLRPASARGTIAPRPPSSLSQSFRLSASNLYGGTRKIVQGHRVSDHGSFQLASSPWHESESEISRPLSPLPAGTHGDRRRSPTAMILSSDKNSSATITPLANYSKVCDMFPKPLSLSTNSRPPTWILPQKTKAIPFEQSSQTTVDDRPCPSSPRPIPRGLPSNPRYFIEQRNSTHRGTSPPCPRHAVQSEARISKLNPSTTGKHSPLRRSLAYSNTAQQLGVNTVVQATQIPTPRAGTPLALQIDKHLRQKKPGSEATNSKAAENDHPILDRVLGPVSVNIGSPTQFTANKDRPQQTLERTREMSPSPPSRGHTSGIQSPDKTPNVSSPYGAIGEERNLASASLKGSHVAESRAPKGKLMYDDQLKKRIREAKMRKAHAQFKIREDTENPEDYGEKAITSFEAPLTERKSQPIGLGIILSHASKRKADSASEAVRHDSAPADATVANKRRRSSTYKNDTTIGHQNVSRSRTTGTNNRLQQCQPRSQCRVPSPRRVRFSETDRVYRRESSNKVLPETEALVYSVSFRRDDELKPDMKRLSSSPGRIWKEEVF